MILGNSASDEGNGQQDRGNYLPNNICTVCKKFNLEPITHAYATCPKCSCIYPADKKGKLRTYPQQCTFMRYQGGKPCGQILIKTEKQGHQKVRIPIKPYII